MSYKGPEENKFDIATARVLDNFAQRLSRRSMLARVGKFAFSVLGVSLVPLLPVDRIVTEAEAQEAAEIAGCGDWALCGIWGRRCDTCACVPGTIQTCPACTYQGSLWRSCCVVYDSNGNPTTSRKIVDYIDCCGQQGAISCTGDARTCDAGTRCFRNPDTQPVWCGGAGGNIYHCTKYRVGTTC